MRRTSPLCAALLLLLFCASTTFADDVRLKNGDRFSGTVDSLAGGTLTFKTPHGDLAIPWAEVASLTVADAIVVTAADGTETPSPGGDIDVAATVALARPQPSLDVTGGAGAGFVDTGGNTDVNSLRLDGEVVMRARENRYTFSGAVNRAEDRGVETARNWTSSARYDRFLTERLFLNANTIFTSDAFRALDLRTALGLGVGYQVADTPMVKLSVDAGFGYVNENFETAPDDSYGALREAGKLDVFVAGGERVVLFHQHDGYFGVTGDENLFVKTQNGVRFGLVAGFVTTLQLDLDYDRSPAPGRQNTDRTFALTFGYRF
jgi:putative salt-induced outer membrane protein YdiY